MTFEQKRAYATGTGYAARWDKVVDASIELDQDLLEAEAVWGDEVRSRCKPLRDVAKEVGAALSFHMRNLTRPPEERSASRAFVEAKEAILYADGEDDPTNLSLRAAIEKIEAFLAPHLRRTAR